MKENKKSTQPNETNDSRLASNAGNEPIPIYLTPDSTLQTPEEARHDRTVDPTKDDSLSVSSDDLHETGADRLAGSDRTGTAERTDNSV